MEKIPVYILAGGASSRFGSDKARAEAGGKPLVVGLARAVAPAAASVTVVAERAGKYEDLGLRTIADLEPGHGPLGGLQAALGDLGELGAGDWLLLLSCDLAGVQIEWIERLWAARRAGSATVLFRDQRWQPLLALYHVSARRAVDELLARGQRKMYRLMGKVDAVAVAPPDDWHKLRNVNRPEDLPREG